MRSRVGPLSDAIIRQNIAGAAALEYGAIECSGQFTGESAPKWTSDTDKLTILLRDQIVHINKITKGRKLVLRSIETVGFITAGLWNSLPPYPTNHG